MRGSRSSPGRVRRTISSDKTSITTVGPSIIDTNRSLWTITSGAQLAYNGAVIGATSGVIQIAYVSSVVWQKNNAGNWYSMGLTNGVPAVLTGPTTVSPLSAAINFPPTGFADVSGVEGTLATSANQPGGVWTGRTIYNEYSSWTNWSTVFGIVAGPPYFSVQISPQPRTGYTFNAADLISNHDADYQALAQNLATYGQANITSVNIGWEWNSGGANDYGWDAAGMQAQYIQWWRHVASYFKTYCPNIIRCWAMNHTLMHTNGVPEDFYPGDDVVDAVGMECYGEYVGHGGAASVVATDRTNDFGWLTLMSAATSLGSAHPASTSGSMTIGGVSTPIPTGGKKYIVMAEWQASSVSSTYVQDVFTWATTTVPGRVLVNNYWNSFTVGATGQLLTATNGPGTQWVTANTNKTFAAVYPIPRLS